MVISFIYVNTLQYGKRKSGLRMYEKILQLEPENLAANIFLPRRKYVFLFKYLCACANKTHFSFCHTVMY